MSNKVSSAAMKSGKINCSRRVNESGRKELTRSLIEDASEDFTNIEEHIQQSMQKMKKRQEDQ
jgi:hypothetical protein